MLSRKPAFDHKKLPGFIMVPARMFTAQSLHDYVQLHIHECRKIAKNYVEEQKLKQKVSNALKTKQ